jgi:hypothetical protein
MLAGLSGSYVFRIPLRFCAEAGCQTKSPVSNAVAAAKRRTHGLICRIGEKIDVVIVRLDRVPQLNPSFARGWQCSAWVRLWVGQPDLAIQHFETALRLSPREHRANPFLGIGVAHFFAGRFEEARRMLLLSLQENRTGSQPIDFSHPAARIWAASTRREKPSTGCAL